MFKLLTLVCVVLLNVYLTEQSTHFLSDEYIKQINKIATTWKAKTNFPRSTTKEYINGLLGSKGFKDYFNLNDVVVKKDDPLYTEENLVPKNFDARNQWVSCTKIGHIRDQGNCGSCWAFGTTGAFADRLCVATNGTFNELLSPEELTFCCWTCGLGCHGGNPIRAWKYFKSHGIVTGGDYDTRDGCSPYKVPPCHNEKGKNICKGKRTEHRHKCPKKCYGNNPDSYHFKTKNAYVLDTNAIMKDIMTYGPIETSFDVYDDFMNYGAGIYQKTPNATYLGGHSVKLIGWGQNDDGPPFWVLVNSWSKFWGEKGTFRIIRGKNECEIEKSATAGVPSLEHIE